ncbi:MAG: hypothetical protein R3C56_10055 [Pirellulaceae bacterium]
MSRNEALKELQNVLVTRRNALRAALKGDLSCLRELTGASGELADFALDSVCGETTSRMAEVESMELAHIDEATRESILVTLALAKDVISRFRWRGWRRCRRRGCASSAR